MADEKQNDKDQGPAKSELQGAVLQGGTLHPAGTKISDLDLSDDEKKRLKDLGVIEG